MTVKAQPMRLAYLASTVTLPGSPTRRSDAFEHDHMMRALREGLEATAGPDASWTDIAWDDPDADWSTFDAVMIGSTWDYWDRQEHFLSTLQRITGETRLFNPPDLVTWNSDKSYLKDLAAKGAPTIPTVWLDNPNQGAVNACFDTFGTDDLVIKRQVGAGADGQHRLQRGAALPRLEHAMMAQPFLPEILTEGEISFVYIDGEFSHALIKRAATGDYRIQSTYGGTEETFSPAPDDVRIASGIIGLLDQTPLYARVDMLRGPDDELQLMELELIEPYLYPLQGPELGERIARALMGRLGS